MKLIFYATANGKSPALEVIKTLIDLTALKYSVALKASNCLVLIHRESNFVIDFKQVSNIKQGR